MTHDGFRRRIKRAVAVMLTIALVGLELNGLSFGGNETVKAEAATGKAMKNTYILALTSGTVSKATDNILMFAITYSSGAYDYRQLFFLDSDAYNEGLEICKANNLPMKGVSSDRFSVSGYERIDRTVPFKTVGTEMFMFSTDDIAVDEIKKVEVFTRTEQTTGTMKSETWNLRELAVYQVDTLYGTETAGSYSGSMYYDFEGRILADTKRERSITWNTDAVITFGNGGGQIPLTTYSSKAAGHEFSTHNVNYTFKIDITDTAMAGIEEFYLNKKISNATVEDMKLPECLYMRMEYEDMDGNTQRIYIPVITSALKWLSENKVYGNGTSVSSLFQQGDQIVFSANLPGFKSLKSTQLSFTVSETDKNSNKWYTNAGIRETYNVAEHRDYLTLISQNNETEAENLVIDGIQMYKTDAVGISTSMRTGYDQNGIKALQSRYEVKVEGNPIYFYTADNFTGKTLALGVDTIINMTPYTEGKLLSPKAQNNTDQYLVSITTSNSLLASTTSDIGIKLTYIKTDTYKASTEEISIRKAVRDFLGYCPSNQGDAGYLQSMSKGATCNFIINAKNIEEIDSITLNLNGEDEWQFDKIEVRKINKLYPREVFSDYNHTLENENGTIFMQEYISRRAEGDLIARIDETKLLQASDTRSVTIYFSSKQIVNEESGAYNWDDSHFSMTYEVANKDLGFADVKCKYLVTVCVADDDIENELYGDCGSRNNFFFRLIFENGSSGYVLANEQLSSDGFRAGYQETFYIYTNSDYGNLEAIHIIPDDFTSNNELKDKLEISWINVTKQEGASLNRTWGVDHVGWIGAEIREEGIISVNDRPSRNEDQLAKMFVIEYERYDLNLLFEVAVKNYDENLSSYTGAINGVLNYIDTEDQQQTKSFDLVKAIGNYSKKTVREADYSIDGTMASTKKMGICDPNYMFAGGRTTRFMIEVPNPKVIQSLTFQFSADKDTSTTIKTGFVSVGIVTEDGEMRLVGDEFIRDLKSKPLTISVSSPEEMTADDTRNEAAKAVSESSDGHEFYIPLGQCQEYTIFFAEQTIQLSESSWSACITREPNSANDKVNVIAYMDMSQTERLDRVDMACDLTFTRVDGQDYVTKKDAMLKNTAQGFFYENGISVSQMAGLSNLGLKSFSSTLGEASNAALRKVILQHIRNGIVMNSYFYDMEDNPASTVFRASIPISQPYVSGDKQVVMLSFDNDSDTMKLINEKRDLAVALVYKTSYDDTLQYQSKYKFVTDAKYESDPEKNLYDYIRPGNSICVTFNEEFVGEIVGVKIIPTEKLNIKIDKVAVGLYRASDVDEPEGDDDGYAITDWYSFANSENFEKGALALTDPVKGLGNVNSLMPVTFTINTMEGGEGLDCGTGGRISMELTYTSLFNDQDEKIVINDISDYVPAQSFREGKEATFTILVPAMKQLRNVKLTPDETAGGQGWGLAKITAKYYAQTSSEPTTAVFKNKTKNINEFIVKGSSKEMCFADIAIGLEVIIPSDEQGLVNIYHARSTDSSDVSNSRLVDCGKTITIKVNMDNAPANAFDFKCVEVSAQGHEADVSDSYIRKNIGGNIIFTPESRTVKSEAERSSAIANYVLTVYSTEDSAFKVSYEFGVRPMVVEPEPEQNDPSTMIDLNSLQELLGGTDKVTDNTNGNGESTGTDAGAPATSGTDDTAGESASESGTDA